jgi:hypothetical protein
MSDVRRRARIENQRDAGALRNARKTLPADLIARVSRLQARIGGLKASVAQIGGMPPSPPTLRGKVGASGIHVMRRALFWLIPNLQAAQEQLIAVVDDQTKALEEIVTALEKTNLRIEVLIAGRQSAEAGLHDDPRNGAGYREPPR